MTTPRELLIEVVDVAAKFVTIFFAMIGVSYILPPYLTYLAKLNIPNYGASIIIQVIYPVLLVFAIIICFLLTFGLKWRKEKR